MHGPVLKAGPRGRELGSEFLEVVRSQSMLGPCRMGEDFGLWGAVQRF